MGPEVQVSPANSSDYSTTAAAQDPTEPTILYASANNVSSPHVVGFVSGDDGASWGVTIPPRADNGPTAGTFFPSAVFDARGELYQAYMPYAVSGGQLQSQIVVARSTNKGSSWEHAAVVEPPASGPERPRITVDRGAGRFHNRLYVAYNTNPSPNASPIVVAHSDNGLSWTRTTVDPNIGFAAVPAVAPDGTVYVVWDDWCYPYTLAQCPNVGPAAVGAIKMARSTDGGATFSPPAIVQVTARGFGTRITTASNCPVEWWVTATPSLVIDPRSGTLYLAYTDPGAYGPMHVFAGRSTDGVTFTGWTSVAGTDYIPAWQGTLAVDPTNGVVGLSYYYGAPQYTPYYSESLDGTNWTAQPIPLANSSDATLGCTGTGDYMQMVLNSGVAHPLWVDTRNGHDQVFTRTVDEALAALPPPLPRPVNPALFQSPLQTGDVAFSGVATGDFDGDGRVDLAYPGWDSSGTHQGIYFRHGNGDGTFAAPAFTQAPSTPFFGALNSPIAANIDGKLDLIMSGNVSSPTLGTCQGIIMVPGNGDGTFSFAKGQWECVQGYGSIAVADFDHDGTPDIAIAGNGLWVSLTKAGVLQAPTRISMGNTYAVAAADMNGDGNLDLVTAGNELISNQWTGVIRVLLGDGKGAFPITKTTSPVGLTPSRVAVGDFNGDGKLDVAVEEIDFQWPRVFLGNGDGTFTESTGAFENLGAQLRGDKGIVAGDFNGDGKQDIIYGNAMWQGKGDGTFTYYGSTGVGSAWLGMADLNGDRYLDLLAANDTGVITLSLAANPPPPAPAPSIVTLSATALNFATTTVGMATASQVLTVRYTGPVPASVGVPVIAGANPLDFKIGADTCIGATLPDKGSCSVTVQFTPQAASSRSATLEIPNNGPSAPQSVALTGTGAGSSQPFYQATVRDQFQLTSGDGATWVSLDDTNLGALITPAADSSAVIGGNADLWTAIAGVNQDLGVLIAGGSYGSGQVVAWKESGGSAGTYSPNAAFVQTVQDLKANTSYVIALMWKTNRTMSSGTIFMGAGQRPGFSPSSLTVQLVPSGSPNLISVATTAQHPLTGSDGTTWSDMDPALTIPFTPTMSGDAIISANADLWTSTAGYNQDIAINVNGAIAAWKESGGFAGTYSPNAAFVQTVYQQMSAGTPYTIKLQWKANRHSPAGAQIWVGAGPIGNQYSPTRLTIHFVPGSVQTAYTTGQQYNLPNSNGVTWRNVDPTTISPNRLQTQVIAASSCLYLVSANVDLWTSQAGYNQDIGISVTGGNYPTVANQPEAWKESGGFAGTFSPNAAYVETVLALSAGPTYVMTMTWKTNKPANGATIWAGAGPIEGGYSPARLTIQPLC